MAEDTKPEVKQARKDKSYYPLLYNENSLLHTVEGVAVDEMDLVVIEGQSSELWRTVFRSNTELKALH